MTSCPCLLLHTSHCPLTGCMFSNPNPMFSQCSNPTLKVVTLVGLRQLCIRSL